MTRQRDKVARAELASVRWRCGYRWLHVVLKREGVPTRGSAAPFSECFASLLWIICFAPHAADPNAIRQADGLRAARTSSKFGEKTSRYSEVKNRLKRLAQYAPLNPSFFFNFQTLSGPGQFI